MKDPQKPISLFPPSKFMKDTQKFSDLLKATKPEDDMMSPDYVAKDYFGNQSGASND